MNQLEIDKTKIVGDKICIIDFDNIYQNLVNEITRDLDNDVNIVQSSDINNINNINNIYKRVYILLILSDNNICLNNIITKISSTGSYILVTPIIYSKYHTYHDLLIEITDNQNFINYINIEKQYRGTLKHARFSKIIDFYLNVNNINNPELDIYNIKQLPLVPNYDSCNFLSKEYKKIIHVPDNINNLTEYRHIFFGGYCGGPQYNNQIGINKLLNSKNCIIVWMGSDILKVLLSDKYHNLIKNKEDLIHIGISKNICMVLNYMNVSYKYCLMPTIFNKSYINNLYNEKYNVDDKNNNTIYCYDADKDQVYNYQLLKHLQRKLTQFNFIIVSDNSRVSQKELLNIYKLSFLGLRLTDFDGNARTALEMGMLGKKVVSNIEYPNCIPWKGLEDLEKTIIDEYNKQVVYYPELREECYKLFKSHEVMENYLLNV